MYKVEKINKALIIRVIFKTAIQSIQGKKKYLWLLTFFSPNILSIINALWLSNKEHKHVSN